MLNKHGLKINGVKEVASASKCFKGAYETWLPSYFLEVFYNAETGDVWQVAQAGCVGNTWTVQHDENIIKVCDCVHPMSMQDVCDKIKFALDERNRKREFWV